MRFGFKQPLVREKLCVKTLITAAEETYLSFDRNQLERDTTGQKVPR